MHTTESRLNLYAGIHKAVRGLLAQALVHAGQTDWRDPVDRIAMLSELRELLGFCRAHLRHENTLVHPAMEARAPGSTARVEREHVEHEHALDALERMVCEVETSSASACVRAGEALYRALAVFVGDNLLHMNVEETEHNAALWGAYSDAEIEAIHQTLVASLPPDEAAQSLNGILCFSSPAERAELLLGIRAQAPAPVVEDILAALRPQLTERDRAKLDAALAMPLHQAA